MNDEKNGLPFEMAAFDLDGTLMTFDMEISDGTLAALESLRERGVRVVLATGRRYEGAKIHAERLGFAPDDPLVCYGGAVIRSINGHTTLAGAMSTEEAVEVIEWAEARGLRPRVLADEKIIAPSDDPSLAEMAKYMEDEVEVVESPKRWLEENPDDPIRVTIVDFPEKVEEWLPEAEDEFSPRLFVARSLPHYVEFGSPEGKKSAALAFLCEKWNIDPGHVMAFGDGENDIDMLHFAGRGVAVGGMTDAVRDAADATTDSVNEEGVARYIEGILAGAEA